MPAQGRRQWGFWTRFKLELLQAYLDAFTTAASDPRERIYLDAFAGESRGVDRITGEEFPGSVRIALDTDRPSFTRLRFFELPSRADQLATALGREYPGRDIKVYPGDCNETIPEALADLEDVRWAPTFAFIDPDGMELAWETLEALARHKVGYKGDLAREFKVELWLNFPSGGLIRTLALDERLLTAEDADRATRLFGTDAWRRIYERRRAEEISGAMARDAYVNLLRWRLERDLGYRSTHPLEIKNERGVPIYHMVMVFATDNEAGDRIMTHLYGQAASRFTAMRQEALDRRSGQLRLDLQVEDVPDERLYEYEPPYDPDQL